MDSTLVRMHAQIQEDSMKKGAKATRNLRVPRPNNVHMGTQVRHEEDEHT